MSIVEYYGEIFSLSCVIWLFVLPIAFRLYPKFPPYVNGKCKRETLAQHVFEMASSREYLTSAMILGMEIK